MSIFLVVTHGGDLGQRLRVDTRTRVVGRARGLDLVLTDLRVSRKHLEVTGVGALVRVRLCSGAAPFVVDGREQETFDAKLGDRIIVGDTVLTVVDESAVEEQTPAQMDDVHTLLAGAAAEVSGLAAVYALTEALDAAHDRAAIEIALAAWARRHAEAESAEITLEGEGADPMPGGSGIVVRGEAGASVVSVPTHAGTPGVIRFRLRVEPARLPDHVRRLLVVGARACASSLDRVRAMEAVEDDKASLRQQAFGSARDFLGTSPAAQQIAKLVPRLAVSEASVLLLGETGSGKTFVARLIHEAGPRAREPLRVLNCAAIPETLLESELFGHEKGAFTGAVSSRAGAFESAGEGTVLLDEVGELPLVSQAKLLRVLEDKRFERIGSNRALPLRARVLAATNRDLSQMVEAGKFRSDLFFRLSVVNVRVPPLRERADDLVLLAKRILTDLAPSAGRRIVDFSPAALAAIRAYAWPGNVRELRNAIERAIVLGDGPMIEAADLPEALSSAPPQAAPAEGDPDLVRLPQTLDALEARAIEAALRASRGNRTRAAALLGINRVTLYKKLKEDPP